MNGIPSQCDLVVVGSGAAGLVSAITAAEGGAKIIVFEKQRSFGGTSNFLQGTFAVESRLQRERYITYNRDEAFKNIMEYNHWRCNPRLVRAIVNETAKTIDWLQSCGVEFLDATINMPDSPHTYHVLKGKGEAMVKALVTKAKQMGIELIPSTPVKKVLKSGDRMANVIVERDGEDVQIATKAVVIASGGFANNKDWIKKYTGFDLGVNLVPIGNTDKTGDGIRMAFETGATDEGLGVLELYRVGPVGPEFAMGCQIEFAATQPDLWVNPRGERFCDESIGFYDSTVGNASARYKEGYTFSIFDDSITQRMMEHGIDKNVGVDYPPGSHPNDLDREMQAALNRGGTDVFAADSVESLAQRIGVDPAVFKSTVDEYNRSCELHYDALFAKDPRYLRPLVGPKYYAVKARTVFLGTMGGIKINERAEALDKKDRVIPGLYAAGFDAGGMYGDSYPIRYSSGLASAFALNSGRLAGKSILKYLGK